MSWGAYDLGAVGAGNPKHLYEWNGKLYVVCLDTEDVFMFDGVTWEKTDDMAGDPYMLLAYDGNLYCTIDSPTNQVWKWNGSAWSVSLASAGVNPRKMIVFNFRLYVACEGNDAIYELFETSWQSTGLAGDYPNAFEEYDGKLYVSCFNDSDVYELNVDFWDNPQHVGSLGQSFPADLKTYNGKLYCALSVSNEVWVYNGVAWAKDDDVGQMPTDFK
jgi:hypothetical protein